MKFTKTVLDNGLRLITVPMKDNQTVTAMVLVEAGSRYESKEKNGISHFLEHMCFKGTVKRPNVRVITTEFESLGIQYNAFTAGTYTGYYAKASKDKGSQILEMVSDLYLNATLPEEEIEKEKSVVIEEMNMTNDRPDRIVWDLFDELAYGDHPAGRPIIGNKETVSSLMRNDLVEYRKLHYVPGKTVVVVSGNIDEEQIQKEVNNLFGAVAVSPVIEIEKVSENQTEAQVKIHDKKTDQTHFVLGFRAFSRFDERHWALSILSTVLGNGMSSRLFQRIREELGLCYYISASPHLEADCGMFVIRAGVAHDKIGEAVREITKILKEVSEKGITEEELQKAKDFKLGHMYLGLETSDALADFYGFQEIDREQVLTADEVATKLREVTLEQVLDVARDIIRLGQANLAVVGPHQGTEDALRGLLC